MRALSFALSAPPSSVGGGGGDDSDDSLKIYRLLYRQDKRNKTSLDLGQQACRPVVQIEASDIALPRPPLPSRYSWNNISITLFKIIYADPTHPSIPSKIPS